MKSFVLDQIYSPMPVAPLVGAWIEILPVHSEESMYGVAPLVGAWIEIIPNDRRLLLENCRSSCRSVD